MTFCLFIALVTRSKAALFRAHRIRECFVKIMPNFEWLCRQWLRDTERNPMPARRYSIAGALVFAVNGEVRDFGNDFLPPLPPPNGAIGLRHDVQVGGVVVDNPIEMPEHIEDQHDEQAEKAEQAVINPVEIDEIQAAQGEQEDASIGNNKNYPTEMDAEIENQHGEQIENDELVEDDPMVSVDGAQAEVAVVNPAEEVVPENRPWIAGANRFVDPFRRTSPGFALYGRRRSVCVMTTIPEKN